MNNYIAATKYRDYLDAKVRAASDALRNIPGVGSGQLGLTPDAVKATPEYKQASAAYWQAHKNLGAFNQYYTRIYKKEIREAITAKRKSNI